MNQIPRRFTDTEIAIFAEQAGERARLAATQANAQIAAGLITRPALTDDEINAAATAATELATLEAQQANESFDLGEKHKAARTALGHQWRKKPAPAK